MEQENDVKDTVVKTWEGGAIGMLTLFVPAVAGVVDRSGDLSMLPIARWAALSIAVVVFVIGVIPFVLSFNTAVRQSTQLVSDGIYRHTRHPHYLSNTMWGASIPFFFSSWWSLLFFVFSLPVVYFLIRREEETLIQEYGKEYEDYKTRVPMLIPKW